MAPATFGADPGEPSDIRKPSRLDAGDGQDEEMHQDDVSNEENTLRNSRRKLKNDAIYGESDHSEQDMEDKENS